MKSMTRKMLWILPLAAMFALVACEDDEVAFEAEADVFTLAENNEEGQVVYAPVYYVYGNKSMDEVTVISPNGNEVELGYEGGMKSRFLKEPADEDFQRMPVAQGNYNFDILTSGGKEVQLSDRLESSSIPPTSIDYAKVENNVLDMEWNDIGANAYTLRIHAMTDDGDQLIFGS